MYMSVVRYGKRMTERGTKTNYACFDKDIESIKKYIRAHKHEKYEIEVQKWAFDVACIVRFYPEVE